LNTNYSRNFNILDGTFCFCGLFPGVFCGEEFIWGYLNGVCAKDHYYNCSAALAKAIDKGYCANCVRDVILGRDKCVI
jgi:hypothetical protein